MAKSKTDFLDPTERQKGIGGTDALRIMAGDWRALWREKMGIDQPKDFAFDFPVQLGIYTEPFHMNWLSRLTNLKLKGPHRQSLVIDRNGMKVPIIASQDGEIANDGTPVQLKHLHAASNVRQAAIDYAPQLTHYMIAAVKKELLFSMIAGNREPEFVMVGYDEAYANELLDLEAQFWWHVVHEDEPEMNAKTTRQIVDANAKAINLKLNGQRKLDMTKNNEWCAVAGVYQDHESAAKIFETAKADIKKLMPDDCYEAFGGGLVLKRDARGAIRITRSESNDA
jgi:hypothetical protein